MSLIAIAAVAGLAVAGVLAFAILMAGGGDRVVTDDPADGTVFPQPPGARWLVLDLPGVVPTGGFSELRPASQRPETTDVMQAFRSDAGFDGPAVWVLTVPAGSDFGFGEDSPGSTEVSVQGSVAYLRQQDGVVKLGWPGGDGDGFDLIAVHLTANEVVAFAEGLRGRPGGEGWEATALPQGLGEVDLGDDPPVDTDLRAEWEYTGPDGEHYELFVDPATAEGFELRVRETLDGGGTVSDVSVEGRPGIAVERQGESVAVWRSTDTTVADFRTSDDLLTALEALRPVDEAAWLAHFPPDVRPEPPPPEDQTPGG